MLLLRNLNSFYGPSPRKIKSDLTIINDSGGLTNLVENVVHIETSQPRRKDVRVYRRRHTQRVAVVKCRLSYPSHRPQYVPPDHIHVLYICYSAPVVGVAIGTPLFPLKRLSSLSLSLSLRLYIISLAQLSKSRAVRRGLPPATRSMSKMNVPLRYADS